MARAEGTGAGRTPAEPLGHVRTLDPRRVSHDPVPNQGAIAGWVGNPATAARPVVEGTRDPARRLPLLS